MHLGLDPTTGPRTGGGRIPTPPATRRRRVSRHVARVVRTVGGVLLLLAGAAMLVLPGPGLLAIAAGLALLAVDYHWAKRLLVRTRQRIDATGQAVRRRSRRSR